MLKSVRIWSYSGPLFPVFSCIRTEFNRGTTDAISDTRKTPCKSQTSIFYLFDFEKALNRFPRKVPWCPLQKFGIDEWFIKIVPVMKKGRSCVWINSKYYEYFSGSVGKDGACYENV